MRARGWASSAIAVALCAAAACGARRPSLPEGAGAPFPGFTAAYGEATAECRSVRSLTASLRLSGRSGGQRLGGRIDVGLAAPSRVRLEGFPPVLYGSRPYFVLVADAGRATLLLPRDARVLRDEPPDAIVDALAGVAIGPADLLSMLAGCGLGEGEVSGGRLFRNGWAAAERGGATVYLRPLDAGWRMAAATRGAMHVHYGDYVTGRPQAVRISTDAAGDARADITLRLSGAEWNVALDDRVFAVEVPPGTAPLTLEDLRAAGPMRAGGR